MTDHERTARLSGLHRDPPAERRRRVAEALGIPVAQLEAGLADGGLDPATADRVIENVLGVQALPFSVATNFRVDGVERLVPMAIEEPSVVAAASVGAKMIRAGGGFTVDADPPITTAQVELHGVRDRDAARRSIEGAFAELHAAAADRLSRLVSRGGGLREIEVRGGPEIPDANLVVHLHVDCRDAMGANLVNGLAEMLGPRLAELAGAELGICIVTNLADRRLVRVRAHVPSSALAPRASADEALRVRDAIVRASRFAETDVHRAVTHNKGVMNGVDPVVVATGNDWRAVEAGAHAWAARSGAYRPLCTWRSEDGGLHGELTMPLAVGTVGGITRVHPLARLAIEMTGVRSAVELAGVAAAAGMACNLAALRTLTTVGIQTGHMALHARSVAAAAGATGAEVEVVARIIHRADQVTPEAARSALDELRADSD